MNGPFVSAPLSPLTFAASMESREFDEKLISLVRKFQNLYDVTSEYYKDEKTREQSWTIIAADLSTTMDTVKRKWRILRSNYVRERKTCAQSHKKRKWIYFDALSFRDPYLLSCKSRNPGMFDDTEEICVVDMKPSVLHHHISDTTTPTTSAINSNPAAVEDVEAKDSRDYDLPVHNDMPVVTELNQHRHANDSSDELYCGYILSRLKKLRPHRRHRVKIQFEEALFQAECEEEEEINNHYAT